jgi:hypothetical protein
LLNPINSEGRVWVEAADVTVIGLPIKKNLSAIPVFCPENDVFVGQLSQGADSIPRMTPPT